MRFALPHMLWLLLLVPLIGAGLVWAAGYRRTLLARFGSDQAFGKRGIAAIGVMTWLRMGLFLTATTALVLGLARPQWGYHERQVITHGVDMVVAIDTSDSMMARDLPPQRLTRAKDLLRNLIWEAQGSRVGLVAFSGSAAVMCPLTLDYNMAITALKAVDTNTVSSEGTNIGAAIRAARGAFEVSGANDRVLVLLTDGEQLDHPEDLDLAVQEAANDGVKIFAIGLGSTEGSTIPTMAGPKRASGGEIVQTRLNFSKLQEIASKTGGIAIQAESAGASEITEITSALAQFKGRKQQDKTYRVYQDRYPWFVGFAAFLLVLDALLAGVNRLRLGRREIGSASAALFFGGILIGSATDVFAYPGEDYVRSREAWQKFHAGDFEQSAELYEKAAEVNPQNSRIHFNLGAAAARAGKSAEARESLGKVYDPQNPSLNAYAQYGVATLDHRELRKQIGEKKSEWTSAADMGEAPVEEIREAVDQLKDIIQQYKGSILDEPGDLDMKANFELAKKDLEELEQLLQQNQDQQQQQQQEQPQQNEQQQNQPQDGEQEQQESGEGQQGEQQNQSPEPGDQNENEQEQEQPEGQQGEQENDQPDPSGENQQDQNPGDQQQNEADDSTDGQQDGSQQQQDPKATPTPAPSPTPSPTPQSTPQPGQESEGTPQPGEEGQPVPLGQMSAADVDRLLNTLPPENQQAIQLLMGTPTEKQDMEHDW